MTVTVSMTVTIFMTLTVTMQWSKLHGHHTFLDYATDYTPIKPFEFNQSSFLKFNTRNVCIRFINNYNSYPPRTSTSQVPTFDHQLGERASESPIALCSPALCVDAFQ